MCWCRYVLLFLILLLTSISSLLGGFPLFLWPLGLACEFLGCSFFLFRLKFDSWGQLFFRICTHLSNITGWKIWLATLPGHKEQRVSRLSVIVLIYVCNDRQKFKKQPWLVWLSIFSASLETKGSPVRFPVRAHAWVASWVPCRGHVRGNHILMFLSFSFSLPSPLSKNK